jgi:hypothetical protein
MVAKVTLATTPLGAALLTNPAPRTVTVTAPYSPPDDVANASGYLIQAGYTEAVYRRDLAG